MSNVCGVADDGIIDRDGKFLLKFRIFKFLLKIPKIIFFKNKNFLSLFLLFKDFKYISYKDFISALKCFSYEFLFNCPINIAFCSAITVHAIIFN